MTRQQAITLFNWYYGRGQFQAMEATMSPRLIALLRQMITQTVQCSVNMGYVEAVFRSAMKVNPSVVSIIKAVAKHAARAWASSELGKAQKIYSMCKSSVARGYRTRVTQLAWGGVRTASGL